MELFTAKGMQDLMPEEKMLFDETTGRIIEAFRLYGFVPLDTPVIERMDVLGAKYAGGEEILKEVFRVKDQGDRELGLIYDLTVPLARVIGMNKNLKMPFKRYQIAKVYRDGPVEKNRYREFYQCDADIIGSKELLCEAELLGLTKTVFEKLDLKVKILINSRKLLNEIMSYVGINEKKQLDAMLSIDRLEKVGLDAVKKELKKEKGLNEKEIEKLIGLVGLKGSNEEKLKGLKKELGESKGIKEIESVLNYCRKMKVEVELDLMLARGLAYYTGPIFEAVLSEGTVKASVAGGGRYDELIGKLAGLDKEVPAVGISFGLNRIIDALKEKKKKLRKSNSMLLVMSINAEKEMIGIANELRKRGINLEIDLMNRNLSKNLDYANGKGVPFVLIVGEKDLKEGKVTLKNMQSGKEEKIDAKALDEIVKAVLK